MIWKGKFQLGDYIIGADVEATFNLSKASKQARLKLNLTSLISKLVKGLENFAKSLVNCL